MVSAGSTQATITAALLALVGMTAAQAATVTLNVVAARTTTPVGVPYKYLINVDNTGTTAIRTPTGACAPADPTYPANCHWTSHTGMNSEIPVFAQGDATSLNGATEITICDAITTTNCIPAGRYLISVLADGFKLDGSHFTVAHYRGDKMAHEPLTLMRHKGSKSWVRISGFATPEQLALEYRKPLTQ